MANPTNDHFDMASFLKDQDLPEAYQQLAEEHYIPLADVVHNKITQSKQPYIVGIHGCQGSGKSTLSHFLKTYLNQKFNLNGAVVSIDDFYLDKEKRETLAQQVHPLLAQRGVPGTHDMELMENLFSNFKNSQGQIKLPRFDKANDTQFSYSQWPTVELPLDFIIFEGWCLGCESQTTHELLQPSNQMESDKDPYGIWRQWVNEQIDDYQIYFNEVDYWIMFRPPSFDVVIDWRQQQEHKLKQKLGDPNAGMSDQQIVEFVQAFERITKHCLTQLPPAMDQWFELDTERNILSSKWSGAETEYSTRQEA